MKRYAMLLGWFAAVTTGHLQATETAPVLAPGDNLVVEGLPQIPAALAERASRFTEFRSAGLQSWHPHERSMLIGTRFADTPQVHHVASPGAARTQLTFFADRVGDEIAAPHVTLVENPRNTESFGATTTDSEGLATRAVTLIEGGVLRGFLHNLYTGSRSGSGSTASATRSLSRPR